MAILDTIIKISICIATRNRANIIGETLKSIISQATEEVEIVVVDGRLSLLAYIVIHRVLAGLFNVIKIAVKPADISTNLSMKAIRWE